MDPFADHIGSFPAPVQQRLKLIATTLHKLMPDAERCIRYGIPTFRMNDKNVIHFAGFKNHVSLFPGAATTAHFAQKLKAHKVSKGTIQFQNAEDLPIKLIEQIARHALKVNAG